MAKSLVVDASFAFNLVLPGPRQARFQTLMTDWKNDGYELCAPTLWVYEITSALGKVIHFGQITPEEGQRALVLAERLGVQLIPPNDVQARLALDWTVRLNRAAAYDSFYLALAETLQCEMWTADKRLYNTVELSWMHWAGDR